MKKNLFILLILLAIFSSCSDNYNNGNENVKKFSLSGKLNNGFKSTVYLMDYNTKNQPVIDSVFMNETGDFAFHKPIPGIGFYSIIFPENKSLTLLLDTTEQVTITADLNNFLNTYKVDGSKGSALITKIEKKHNDSKQKIDSLTQVWEDSKHKEDFATIRKDLSSQLDSLFFDLSDYNKTFIDNNLNSIATIWALQKTIYDEFLINKDKDFDYYVKVDSSLFLTYKNQPYVTQLHDWVSKTKMKRFELKMIEDNISIGKTAPEIIINNQNDEPVQLSNFKGKYTFINIWASGSKSCINNIKSLKPIYKKYKSKNFEIFGVSMDKRKDLWTNAIYIHNIEWTEGLGNSQVQKLYNIKSIPKSFLLDTNGIIIARDLNPEELKIKLGEIIK